MSSAQTPSKYGVLWSAMIRYAVLPFMLFSLSYRSLFLLRWTMNPQSSEIPWNGISAWHVGEVPLFFLLILQARHVSQTSMSWQGVSFGMPMTDVCSLKSPRLWVWFSRWCHRTVLAVAEIRLHSVSVLSIYGVIGTVYCLLYICGGIIGMVYVSPSMICVSNVTVVCPFLPKNVSVPFFKLSLITLCVYLSLL